MPLKEHRRLKPQLENWVSTLSSGITVQFAPSFHPTFPLIDSKLINQIEKNIQEGFVHIFAMNSRELSALSRRFALDCRVIALSAYPPHTSWEDFQAELDARMRFEYQWCDSIRPNDAKGPLFLPIGGFQPENKYREFWRVCDCYKEGSELSRASDLLAAVYAKHHRRSAGNARHWIDAGDKVFKIDPTQHALYPEQRRGDKKFRFCKEVPAGFHYDVVHKRGNEFNLIGKLQTYKNIKRANIDPWGSVRLP